MTGRWERGSGKALPPQVLDIYFERISKMENTWTGNKFTVRTPNLPPATGWDSLPCVLGKYF